jgi:hypothetical protein
MMYSAESTVALAILFINAISQVAAYQYATFDVVPGGTRDIATAGTFNIMDTLEGVSTYRCYAGCDVLDNCIGFAYSE